MGTFARDEEVIVTMTRKVFGFQSTPSFRARIIHYLGTDGGCVALRLPDSRIIEINLHSSDFVGIVSRQS